MDNNFKINETFLQGKKVHELINKEMKLNLLDSLPLQLNYTTYPTRTITDMIYNSDLKNYLFEPINDTNLIYLYLINFMSTNFCFYIYNGNVYSVKHRFTNNTFKGTLFECQLDSKQSDQPVNRSNQKMYIVNLLIHQGASVTLNLNETIRTINDLLNFSYKPDLILDPVELCIKPIVSANYLQSLILVHQCANILCRHLNGTTLMILPGPFNIQSKTVINHQYQRLNPNLLIYFKIKYTEHPDVYYLHALNRDYEEIFYDYADVPSIKVSRLIRTFPNNSIVLCGFNPGFKRWRPIYLAGKRLLPDIIDFKD